MRWLKIKFRMLHAFFAVKYLHLLDYLSEREILVKKHENHMRYHYPVQNPTVYRTFELPRYRGNIQYVIHRYIDAYELWYYPKWKKCEAQNAIKLLDNSRTETFEIQMVAFIEAFLLHPPMFEPSIWVPRRSNFEICVNTHLYSPVFPAGDNPAPTERLPVKKYTVSLDECRPSLTMSFDSEGFNAHKDHFLKNMSDRLLEYLDNTSDKFQKEISGIEEPMSFRKGFDLVPDLVCSVCGAPIVSFKGNRRCIKDYTPEHRLLKDESFRRLHHTDWLIQCEKHREDLNRVQHEVGFDL